MNISVADRASSFLRKGKVVLGTTDVGSCATAVGLVSVGLHIAIGGAAPRLIFAFDVASGRGMAQVIRLSAEEFRPGPMRLDPGKDPLLEFIGSIEHGRLAKDIDKELYGE